MQYFSKVKSMSLSIWSPYLILLQILSILLSAQTLMAAETVSFSPYVDKSGNISLPKDFRLSMTHIGSWFVPAGGASGFHDVYTEAESVRAYRRSGKFPDGATLVKELRASTSGDYTTGKNVSYANSEVKQWFVMIKDSTGRFADNPVWGDDWGWALIKTDNPKVNVTTNYHTECLACHIPAKKTDWVYTEGYPTLLTPK